MASNSTERDVELAMVKVISIPHIHDLKNLIPNMKTAAVTLFRVMTQLPGWVLVDAYMDRKLGQLYHTMLKQD